MDNRVVLSGEEYHDYCKRFDIVWKYLHLCSYDILLQFDLLNNSQFVSPILAQ